MLKAVKCTLLGLMVVSLSLGTPLTFAAEHGGKEHGGTPGWNQAKKDANGAAREAKKKAEAAAKEAKKKAKAAEREAKKKAREAEKQAKKKAKETKKALKK